MQLPIITGSGLDLPSLQDELECVIREQFMQSISVAKPRSGDMFERVKHRPVK